MLIHNLNGKSFPSDIKKQEIAKKAIIFNSGVRFVKKEYVNKNKGKIPVYMFAILISVPKSKSFATVPKGKKNDKKDFNVKLPFIRFSGEISPIRVT
ncbi:MAG: hypothetical protein BroJett020_21980 [Bacteroidota bacterium]|nr:MAG: hypothetical protein BroJett020_21980 [Bacteroidota bacterium]